MQKSEEFIELLFKKVCQILARRDVTLHIIRRHGPKSNRSFIKGYINLKTKTIGLDILTPKTLKLKSANGLIRTLCHEIAHLQRQPYRQWHKRKWIIRQHYPAFYKQVEQNVAKIKKDPILGMHFREM